MMGSFSISSCISLILSMSLILITWETPLKYKPITCLLKVFSVLSHFSWCSCYLYSLNGLLMALPLAWSTLYMYCLMLSSSKHSCFLCCSMHSFSLARVSAKISSLFNTFCTIDMIFITYQNPHNMTNNMTYKDSVNVKNDTLIYQKLDIKSVIIFLIDGFAFMVEKKSYICQLYLIGAQKYTLPIFHCGVRGTRTLLCQAKQFWISFVLFKVIISCRTHWTSAC